ncbi:MAG: hypothetical protein CO170_02985, partial [candidate division SR1 bacterium CG_4_9_14_3_um_filter_40_9]
MNGRLVNTIHSHGGPAMKMKLKNYNWEKLSLELVAVFLGVTAGFVLNNWQVEHQERRLEQKYISGFQQDVAYNNSELENALQADSLWLARTKPLILLVKEKTLPIDSAHVIMRLLSNISRIEYNTGTYSDITNSGNLNLITDFELKDQIVDYQIAINGVNFIDDYFYQYFSDFVMPFIFREYNILNG